MPYSSNCFMLSHIWILSGWWKFRKTSRALILTWLNISSLCWNEWQRKKQMGLMAFVRVVRFCQRVSVLSFRLIFQHLCECVREKGSKPWTVRIFSFLHLGILGFFSLECLLECIQPCLFLFLFTSLLVRLESVPVSIAHCYCSFRQSS